MRSERRRLGVAMWRAGPAAGLVSVLLVACSPPPASSASGPCGPASAAMDGALRAGATVVLGEIHGTREFPRFAGELVCEGLRLKQAVTLGVEVTASDQPLIDRFVDSPGTDRDVAALLKGRHWQVPSTEEDGRRSAALLGLLETVRGLRAAGHDVRVVAFDTASFVSATARDATVAANVAGAVSPHRVLIVLVGNEHARGRPDPGLPSFVPMAAILRGEHLLLFNLEGVTSGGTAWVCEPSCGVHGVGAVIQSRRPAVALHASQPGGYSGEFNVGPVSASPPARVTASGPGVNADHSS